MLLSLLLCAAAAAAVAAAPQAPTPLQALIDAAVASGAPSLTLPAGSTYQQGAAPLLLTASNFLLDGAGSTIVFAPGAGVVIERSTAVEVRALTVDYDPPCFSQGAVVAANASAKTVDVRLDAGFAAPDAPFFTTVEIKLQFFDGATQRRPPQSGACIVDVVGQVAPGVWRVRAAQGFGCSVPALPGLRATISPRVNGPDYQIPGGYVGGAYWVYNSTRVTSRGVTLLGSGNFAISEWGGGGGNVYDGVVLTRKAGHLLSSNTDGFHSFSARAGPTLVNSSLSFMGDDVANLHNRVGLVLSVSAAAGGALAAAIIDVGDTPTPRLDPFNPSRAMAFAGPGDSLVVTTASGAPRAGAPGGAFTLASISWDATPGVVAAARAAIAARPGVAVDPRGIGVWQAVFVQAGAGSGVAPGDVVQFDRFANANAVVAGNTFSDAYDSVMRLQSRGAQLYGNAWARTNGGGLNIGYDADWLEGASDIRDIAVTGNTFCSIGAPPATTMAQVLHVQAGIPNVTQAGNTVAASCAD